eukprot:GFYU01004637.1.p1 GENE.GFYU01004637.1~~GFYU01004637.1.p1  ORF type:complete len:334 (-),score=69.97 GFYU01004637.1:334-1335(-)
MATHKSPFSTCGMYSSRWLLCVAVFALLSVASATESQLSEGHSASNSHSASHSHSTTSSHTATKTETQLPISKDRHTGHQLKPFVGGIPGKLLSVFPVLTFLIFQLAPFKTIQEIKERRSVGNYPVLPYISLAVNCAIWLVYSAIYRDYTILATNVSGLASGYYYTYIYQLYSKKSIHGYVGGAISIFICVILALVLFPVYFAAEVIGTIGSIIVCVLAVSPLMSLPAVIREKNSEAIPITFSTANLMNSIAWMSYGILVARRLVVWWPSAFGSVVATIQVTLYFLYPPKRTPDVVSDDDRDFSALEKGKEITTACGSDSEADEATETTPLTR